MYFNSKWQEDSNLIIFRDATGFAQSDWPLFRHDATEPSWNQLQLKDELTHKAFDSVPVS